MDFILGGLSCMAGCFATHPLDTIKVNSQINITKIKIYEIRLLSLWRGLSPALLREATYSSVRMGLYAPIKSHLPYNENLSMKLLAGGLSGAIGSGISTPTDLLKIRAQAGDSNLSMIASARSIVLVEGLRGLYRGIVPTTSRAAVLTATQLASYDHFKFYVISSGYLKEGTSTHLLSSVIAAVSAVTASAPLDLLKSRYINQPFTNDGRGILYEGTLDCLIKTVKSDGFLALYRGWWPSAIRLGPHTIITFVCLEKLRKAFSLQPL